MVTGPSARGRGGRRDLGQRRIDCVSPVNRKYTSYYFFHINDHSVLHSLKSGTGEETASEDEVRGLTDKPYAAKNIIDITLQLVITSCWCFGNYFLLGHAGKLATIPLKFYTAIPLTSILKIKSLH